MTTPNHSARQQASRPSVPRWTARHMLPLFAGLAFAVLAFALAGCGGSTGTTPGGLISSPTLPSATQTAGTPSATQIANPTATPGTASYAYLYSQIDYPLQIPLSASDTVTLTLSPHSEILSVIPAQGRGTGTVSQPIPLPTDLKNYQDIAASVDTQADGAGPLTWALTTPVRQSLLSSSNPTNDRRYKDEVAFKWDVRASTAGENTVKVVLHLIYVYLDGSEHDGTVEVSQAPIPIVAVQSSVANTALPQFKWPLAGLTGVAGFIALLRFVYTTLKTISDVTEPVKDAAKVANAVRSRVGALQQSPPPPQSPPSLLRFGPTRPPGLGGQDSSAERTSSQASQRPWPPMPGR